MRRTAWIAAIGVLALAGCGGGGGGSDESFDLGPRHWGVPFAASTLATQMVIGVRNLDTEGTTATLQGYKPDGTPYPGPVGVVLDGTDEERFEISDALGGASPEGGWILASTPSQKVEVYFTDRIDAKFAEEASRAIPLPDLGAPLVPFATGANITAQTSALQIANVTSTPVTVTVTPFETAFDPTDPPIEGTDVFVVLGPFESQQFLPVDLTGSPFTTGSLRLTAATPFFVAGVEDLAWDIPRASPTLRSVHCALTFGRIPAAISDFFDFVMIARNDTDDTEAVTILEIRDPDGGVILVSPRTVQIPPRASLTFTTVDPLFNDLFGNVLLAPFVRDVHMELQVPEGVDVAFRQFDPVVLGFNATIVPMPTGFVMDVMDVIPDPLNLLDRRTVVTMMNPQSIAINVNVSSLISEPDGFDGSPIPIGTFTVPPNGRLDFSPDGLVFLDRDLLPVSFIGLRFTSNASFAVTGVRARLAPVAIVISLSPLVVRVREQAE
ncbi:MAG TPA: hypothetical protein VND21_08040 [Planctomycetota bacterium]|nr:hypothetical protein [Planctomycetota bacterium]